MSPCPNPLALETLLGLWTGDLPVDETAAAEEHLFACDHCHAASNRFASLVSELRELIPSVISHAHRDRLVEKGTRVRHTPVDANRSATAHYAPEIDLLVHVLRADLSRAERVDVDVVTPSGTVRIALEHVPFDPEAGEVLIACQRHYESIGDPTFRVHVVEGGQRRQVAEYFVHHVWR